MLLAKSAKLQDGASKAWCPGVLSLYPTKISWQASSTPAPQAPSLAPELHIGLISISSECYTRLITEVSDKCAT